MMDFPKLSHSQAVIGYNFEKGSFPTGFKIKKGRRKYKVTPGNWMSHLKPEKAIKDVAIPGTHDSMAQQALSLGIKHLEQSNTERKKAGLYGHVVAQDRSITEQLAIGIRWFDIRLCMCEGFDTESRNMPAKLQACHGPYIFTRSLKQILEEVKEFLAVPDHSRETVFIGLKREHEGGGTKEFAASHLDGGSEHHQNANMKLMNIKITAENFATEVKKEITEATNPEDSKDRPMIAPEHFKGQVKPTTLISELQGKIVFVNPDWEGLNAGITEQLSAKVNRR
jgi:hypothetical protein